MANESRIITPNMKKKTFVLPSASGEDIYVVEVPGCRFEGGPVCLASKSIMDVPKLHSLKHKFAKLWERIADSGILIKP